METVNQAYRVIYRKFGKFTTRVFPSKIMAEQFAANQLDATVQLASEKPNIPPRCHNMTNTNNRTNRVPCKCGKRSRLTSEEFCFSCSGAPIL